MTDQLDWVSSDPKPKPKRGKREKPPLGPPPDPVEFEHWLSRCIDSGGRFEDDGWCKQACTKGGDPDHYHRKDWSFEYQQTDEDWNPIGDPWVRLKTK